METFCYRYESYLAHAVVAEYTSSRIEAAADVEAEATGESELNCGVWTLAVFLSVRIRLVAESSILRPSFKIPTANEVAARTEQKELRSPNTFINLDSLLVEQRGVGSGRASSCPLLSPAGSRTGLSNGSY